MDNFLLSAFIAIIASSTMAFMVHILRRGERKKDLLLLADVADKAAGAAKLVEETAAALKTANLVVERKLDSIEDTGKTTHALVNSSMTIQMQSNLISTQAHLVSMLDNVQLRRDRGQEPTSEVLANITTAKDKMAELEAALEERLKLPK